VLKNNNRIKKDEQKIQKANLLAQENSF